MKLNFKIISLEKTSDILLDLGHKPYRARQISSWIYRKLAVSFNDMTDLSLNLREQLNEIAYISNLTIMERRASKDGTVKFLFELEDSETIESVLIPNNSGKECYTLCISSQVGCAMGCSFCITGRMGLKRNLKAYEIFDQVIAVKRYLGSVPPATSPSITNIVYMGMGEPFANIKEVIKSLQVLTGPMGFSKRKITVSTSGLIPGFRKLADYGPGINLAVSLNATTDNTRSLIMPVNNKYPIKKLLDACKNYPLKPTRRITFEYVLLNGINDSKEDAVRLLNLLRGIRSKVNLIPYNTAQTTTVSSGSKLNLTHTKPSEAKVLEFQKILLKSGIAAIIRKSKGSDILAACGQLKASYN